MSMLKRPDGRLYLFLISQKENDDYDTYDSAVVAAETESDARGMDPNNGSAVDWEKTAETRYGSWAFHRDQVEVKCIGLAEPGIERGVICSSFNAG